MSNINDMFQVDYLPEKKEIRINLPEEVWDKIDIIIMTRLFQEELVVERQEEARDTVMTRLIEIKPDYDGSAWECENCKELWEFWNEGPKENKYNYCPNCGVKFDKYVPYVDGESEGEK